MNNNIAKLVNNNISNVCFNIGTSSKMLKRYDELDQIEVKIVDFIKRLPKKYQGEAEELFDQYIMVDTEIESIAKKEVYREGIKDGMALSLSNKN